MRKTNPNRVPMTLASVQKAKKEATDEAAGSVMAIFFTVLRDKEGYTTEDLQRVWAYVEALCQEIGERRVSLADLKTVLWEEAGILLN